MSNFVVSARKYRPTRFEDVVGQDHVSNTLKNALQSDKLAHAFLFCGPRGVGKTSCARILAKVINCQNPINKVEPCNECSSCTSFNDNASFNIIELDAASNNSVEHIRTLIEQVRFQPQQGTHKVFIIDEVHMLSSQAFNAFLKTLEEPPPYAIFILATTEKHKILPTILSRCQLFDFKRIQPDGVVKQLQYICEQEGVQADKEALHQIALKADGAMRDALSIFDKVASAVSGQITYKDVISNLNILDYDYYFRLVDAFVKSQLADGFLILDEVMHNGFEPEQLVQGLASHLRELLVSKDKQTVALMEVSDDQKRRYYDQARLCHQSFLLSALNVLNQCDIDLPRSTNKRLATEIAFSKLTYYTYLNDVEAYAQGLEVKKNSSRVLKQADPVADEASVDPVSSTSIASNSLHSKQNEEEKPSKVSPDQPTDEESSRSSESKPIITAAESKEKTLADSGRSLNEVVVDQRGANPSNVQEKNPQSLDDLVIGGASLSSLTNVKESLKSREEELKQARKSMSTEKIKDLWLQYASKHESPSVKAALNNTILTLKGSKLEVVVPSQFNQTAINQEMDLLTLLRDTFGAYDLTFDYIIDIKRFPHLEEVKETKKYSDKEKYKLLAEKNPLLSQLAQSLDLKLDQGSS